MASSWVKNSTIGLLAKNKRALLHEMVIMVNLVMIAKNLLARGTLLAPIQFPMMPQVASYMPRGTIKTRRHNDMQIVAAASSLTPMIPASIRRAWKAHHSAVIIKVEGRATFKYCVQPLKESISIGTKALLISSEQEPWTVTRHHVIKSLIEVAMARPMMPMSR